MTNILCIRGGTIFDEVTGRSIEFTIGVCRKNTTPLSFLRQRCGVRSLKKERGLTAHGRIPAARIQAQPSRLEVIVSDTPAPMMSETDERTPPIIYISHPPRSRQYPRGLRSHPARSNHGGSISVSCLHLRPNVPVLALDKAISDGAYKTTGKNPAGGKRGIGARR